MRFASVDLPLPERPTSAIICPGTVHERVVVCLVHGVVFPSVDIPPGVTIAAANVIFDVDEVRPGQSDAVITVAIYGEASSTPAAPSNIAFDLSNRVPTAVPRTRPKT